MHSQRSTSRRRIKRKENCLRLSYATQLIWLLNSFDGATIFGLCSPVHTRAGALSPHESYLRDDKILTCCFVFVFVFFFFFYGEFCFITLSHPHMEMPFMPCLHFIYIFDEHCKYICIHLIFITSIARAILVFISH